MGNSTQEKPVTQKDLLDLEARLTKKLVSKDELNQQVAKLATKEELRQEVAKLATREALEVVATQILKNTNDIDAIKNELKVIKYRLDRLEEKLDTKFNLVLDTVDKVFKELINHRTERAAVDSSLSRHELRLEDHEERIQKLEKMTA